MKRIYQKLVRDNIPSIIKENGENPIFYKLEESAYWEALLKKDTEELEEVRVSNTLEERKEELADKLEVIRAMAEFSGFTLQDIIEEANKKKEKRGGFSERLFLDGVE